MTQRTTNPKVDFYFNKAEKWRDEFEQLRSIVLDCQLIEELKWGVPCYSFEQGNVVLIHGFKHYCAILFVKGALLPDAAGILIAQTEHTQSHRQIRFTNGDEITRLEPVIKAYIAEAITIEKAGMKVAFKKNTELDFPEEFQQELARNTVLKNAFYALTPGRQRAYTLYFSAPKQSKTRASRIEKCMQRIFDGKGLNE